MEFRQQYRYVDPVTEQATDYLSGWLAADPDKVEAETDFFADQQAYIRSMGAEFIARLQTAVKDAELTETDKPAQEEEINYMVRMEDGSMLYFYRNGYIKYLNGDERIIWSVDSDAYDALMQELDDYVPYWATEEFRQALLQSQ